MFIGHALLAFALATLLADRLGWSADRALALGAVAGAFAALPDVDMAYAAVAIDLGSLTAASLTRPSTLWDATREVHRALTHSLVVSLLAGGAFGLWAVVWDRRPSIRAVGSVLSIAALAALVGVGSAQNGTLGLVVLGAFAVGGLALATLGRLRTDLSGRAVAVAAVFGLLSHPWGDLVTGEPPKLFYPFGARLLDGRVLLHGDPTVHLLGAFALELAVIWLAAVAVATVTDRSWRDAIDPRAAAGLAYGVAAVLMAPPTLEVSYHFVFSILAVGVVCGGLSVAPGPAGLRTWMPGTTEWRTWVPETAGSRTLASGLSAPSLDGLRRRVAVPPSALAVTFTALAGITAALVGYAAVYVAAELLPAAIGGVLPA
ncbi:LexA-binding, inner membrane-associated putative hydrolase [Halorubrum aquaticum]|uniref:LexA-binding, inner membrane-associated putative hydrolase n=1 Tax=Halorubrum aquaticum TaxID=387340 RepID=A0A1I2ZNW9_9EURY|nr:metal-dependent hydrolase [Halorubrum aquaticum]SFH38781.1 LexA-binding, inner membrane-associated putative hydrolase [Halorubrum aquaticum]